MLSFDSNASAKHCCSLEQWKTTLLEQLHALLVLHHYQQIRAVAPVKRAEKELQHHDIHIELNKKCRKAAQWEERNANSKRGELSHSRSTRRPLSLSRASTSSWGQCTFICCSETIRKEWKSGPWDYRKLCLLNTIPFHVFIVTRMRHWATIQTPILTIRSDLTMMTLRNVIHST